jgi:hypothetical protein
VTNSDVEIFNTEVCSVFIPNKSGHNFSAASKYGLFNYVTTGLVNRFSVGHMARKWAFALKSSKPEDYIMLTSLTILTVVGAAIFGHLHGRINLLIFRNNKYIARTVIFKQLFETLNNNESEELNNEL